jgi:molybdopterin converting factor small subunit
VAVSVRLPTILRQHTGGVATVDAEGATVGEVFTALTTQYPGLKGQIVTDDGTLHRFVNVYKNDDDIRYLDKLDTKVGDGDELSVIPAVAGG